MFLDLMDVLREPGNSTEKPIDIAARVVDDIEFSQPIRGQIRAINARRNILATGAATTAVRLQCARCLRDYDQPLDLELEAVIPIAYLSTFLPNAADAEEIADDENELSSEELAALFDGHALDVTELIRQAAVLQMPRKPLCQDDCPGLPEAQSYRGSAEDARWEKLKSWEAKEGKNGSA
jgi:uncharacterized protein